MRKNFLLLPILFLLALSASAQTNLPHGTPLSNPDPWGPLMPYLHQAQDRTIGSFDMNYSQANFDNAIYIFRMNYRYALSQGDTAFRWFIVGCDTIHNSNTQTGYYWKSVSTMHIDSVMFYCGHEHNSNLPDSLVLKIVSVNAAGYPTGTILWSDTMYTSTGFTPPFNQWTYSQVKKFYPNFTITGPARFAMKLEYYGPKIDTFGVIAGFVNGGFCSAFGTSVSATRTHFYPNSYYYYTQFNQQYPTSGGGVVYLDCNGNSSYDANTNEEYYLQNINIWPHVTANILQATANTSTYTICNGSSAPLIAAATDGTPPFSYQWSPNTNLNNATVFNPNASPTQTTIYTVTITDANAAVAKDTVIVRVLPIFTVSNDTTVCVGQAVPLDTYGGPCANFLWTPNIAISNQIIANPIVGPNTTQAYTCQCTGFDGCVGLQTVTVTITQNPIANFTYAPTALHVVFTNTSVGGNSFVWHFGDGNGSGNPFPSHNYANPGTYIVSLIAYNNCGNDTIYDTLMVFGVGVSNLAAEKVFGIAPNPAKDEIRITDFYLHLGDEVTITNAVGQIIFHRNNFEGENKAIDIREFSNGVYFITLKTPYGRWTRKWLKE